MDKYSMGIHKKCDLTTKAQNTTPLGIFHLTWCGPCVADIWKVNICFLKMYRLVFLRSSLEISVVRNRYNSSSTQYCIQNRNELGRSYQTLTHKITLYISAHTRATKLTVLYKVRHVLFIYLIFHPRPDEWSYKCTMSKNVLNSSRPSDTYMR